MKCIQLVGHGVPVRLSDQDAYQIVVRDHDGDYCPKWVWKQHWDRRGEPRKTINNLKGRTKR